jgi:CrcB protein
MTRFLLVCLAGALGSGLRYLVTNWFDKWGVFGVNVVGSFLIAAVAVIATAKAGMSDTTRIVVTAGFLGGFTTYSSFNQQTLALLDAKAWADAAVYLLATLIGCLIAGAAGTLAARRFW